MGITKRDRERIRCEAYSACARSCECCGKRRNTYQHRADWGMDSTARLCAECFIERLNEYEREHPPCRVCAGEALSCSGGPCPACGSED